MKKLVVGLVLLVGVLRGSGAVIHPTGVAATDTAAIQNAINAGGEVTLGEGMFLINATLDVKNGVTVQGQGWEKTVIKQTTINKRCIKITQGSLAGVTVTGGNTSERGAGVHVADGSISWCCISNNASSAGNYGGGGVSFIKGSIDHSIVANNKITGASFGAGIGGIGDSTEGEVTINACLICGNNNTAGSGGGVGFNSKSKNVTVRNCTIVGNTGRYNTGGVYMNNGTGILVLLNNIIVDNLANGSESNVGVRESQIDMANSKACMLGTDTASVWAGGWGDKKLIECLAGNGFTCGDPKFAAAANNDYRLGKGSPAIGAGVTYDGIGVDLDRVAFAMTPSIGCYEGFSVPTVVEDPVIAPAAGKFYPTVDVTLTCETEGAAIYYTTDGTEPSAASTLYEGAITLAATATVSARAFKDGLEPSETVSATYVYKEPAKIGQPDFGAYNFAFEFTADGYAGKTELTDFPVVVRLADNSPEGFSYADTDGSDIRFADEDGNELAHEIDTWNASGESLIWVRLPKLTKNTTFVMYYNGTAYNPATPQAVWGAGYAGVWHMGEADGACADSTGHQLAATPAGATTANKLYTGSDAPIGGARTVTTGSAGKGYLMVPNYDSLALGDTFTMSGWVHATGVTGYPRIFSRKNLYTDGNGWELELGANSTTAFSARGSGSTPTVSGTFAGTGCKNAWLHIAVVYDGGTATVYGNGVALATGSVGKSNPDNGQPLAINCNPSGADGCAYGEFDECRLLDGAVSSDWVKAEYDQGVAAVKFLSAGERVAVVSSGVAMPKISPAECVFYPSIEVAIACATAGATIRYTTDGSDPTASSPVYTGPFTLDATTMVKACAFEASLGESVVASTVFTFEEPQAPEFGEVSVTPRATSTKFVVEIASLGNYGATACDVYLAYGSGEGELGGKTLIAAGATDSFTYTISGLDREATYSYELSVSNNSEFAMVATTDGSFTTLAEDPMLEPVAGDPAATRQAIQEAIDSAADETPAGTVMLGKGLFEIDAELTLGGGVTLVGQGWTNTVIKQTVSARVMTLSGGAKVEGLTLTGGKLPGNWSAGAGALVNNGTISWCCISNNVASGNNIYGGGVRVSQGQIDHSVIASNKAGDYGTGFGAGICYYRGAVTDPMGPVLIDTCLICGNVSNKNGGGVYDEGGQADMLTIRNTTIAGNSAKEKGGGLRAARQQLTLVSCILADNAAGDGANYSIDEGVAAKIAEQTHSCFFGNGSAAFGTDSVVAQQSEFKDAANGDYRLKATSLAVDAGAWYDGIANDLDNMVRKQPKTAAGCYECTEVDHGVVKLNPIVVTSGTTHATLTGSIASLGEGKSATVTLNYGLNAEELTEELTVSGITTDFAFDVTGLTHATHYFYSVTVENDVGRTATSTGDFFTQYDPAIALLPSDSPAENVTVLSTAFASAATTRGTVTLGVGLFEIDAQLVVDGGITVVGQGWDKTIIKQVAPTAASSTRVMTIRGGSAVKGVTMTGGNVLGNWSHGAGAQVDDGTISWCCITNNRSLGNNIYGGGVNIANGTIGHSVVAFNQAGGSTSSGGGIGGYNSYATIVVDTCLVCSNSVPSGENKGHGGGICFAGGNPDVTIRNTTVVGNSTTGDGGGIDISTSKVKLVNDIVWGNTVTSETGEAEVGGELAEGSFGNLVGVDPLFKDAADGGYRVHADSPAVAVGQWYEGIVEDLDGKTRGRKPVAGCYTVRQGLVILIK